MGWVQWKWKKKEIEKERRRDGNRGMAEGGIKGGGIKA